MKKPNHSNDNEGQNYDPATGKYISDDSSPNIVDNALEALPENSDFSGDDWSIDDDEGDDWSLDDEDAEDANEEPGAWLTPGVEKELDGFMEEAGVSKPQRPYVIKFLREMDPSLGQAYAYAMLMPNGAGNRLSFQFARNNGFGHIPSSNAIAMGRAPFGGFDLSNEGIFGMTAYESFFHELAHSADGWLSADPTDRSTYVSYGLDKEMKEDVEAMGGAEALKKTISDYVNDCLAKNKQEIEKAGNSDVEREKAIEKEEQKAESAIYAMVDFVNVLEKRSIWSMYSPNIIDPVSGNVWIPSKVYGHPYGYLRDRNGNYALELFAEICQAMATRPDVTKMYDKLMPKTMKSIRERIRKIYE